MVVSVWVCELEVFVSVWVCELEVLVMSGCER